jgi:hypothetical protein
MTVALAGSVANVVTVGSVFFHLLHSLVGFLLGDATFRNASFQTFLHTRLSVLLGKPSVVTIPGKNR